MVDQDVVRREHLPTSGPIIIDEYTSLPYAVVRFRRMWRKVANAAGIPKCVCNNDSRGNGRNEDDADEISRPKLTRDIMAKSCMKKSGPRCRPCQITLERTLRKIWLLTCSRERSLWRTFRR